MKFSRYVALELGSSSVDPLGFLRPSGALSRQLFPQFTVLSNHPSYQGFLAFSYRFLEREGVTPAKREFARRFRDLEILWGTLNARAGTSVTNITKFSRLSGEDDLKLSQAKKRSWLYARLNYGALGHYSNPSIAWRILEPDGSRLSEVGNRLADSWSSRQNTDFEDLAKKWWKDEAVFSSSSYAEYPDKFQLGSAPSIDEERVWAELIELTCKNNTPTAPLWKLPLLQKTIKLWKDEQNYPDYFPSILQHFNGYPELCRRIKLCEHFELMAGMIQFVFEWEYVKRLDEVKTFGFNPGKLPEMVSKLLTQVAISFVNESPSEMWGLPSRFADGCNYEEICRHVLAHHAVHQRNKGAAAFIVDGQIAVQERVDAADFKRFFERLSDIKFIDQVSNAIRWRYKRDWHFGRADLWMAYSRGFK